MRAAWWLDVVSGRRTENMRFPQDWPSAVRSLAESLVEAVAYFRREARWKIRTSGAEDSRRKARAVALQARRLRREASPEKWREWVAAVRVALRRVRPDGMPGLPGLRIGDYGGAE